MNSEIRTLQFSQGVGVALPPSSADVAAKITLVNNTSTPIPAVSYALTAIMAVLVQYYIYRRTDSGYKSMSGVMFLEAQPDGATNADKWKKEEHTRIERGGDSGIAFTLDTTIAGEFILGATLDSMAGTNHSCIMYYKISTLLA